MQGTMSMEVLEQQCEEMLREAELNRLKKALRADRKMARYLALGFDRGVGAGEDRWYPPQVLQGAEERRLGLEETA